MSRVIKRIAVRQSFLALALFCWAGPFVGCSRFINAVSSGDPNQGYTLILTGIEGSHVGHASLVGGLRAGGVNSKIEVYDWTTGNPGLMLLHLRHEDRHRRQTQIITDKIVDYATEYPRRPINLIGHSGGGGMAILALEALPSEQRLEGVILLQAAISPTYDLRPLLPKVNRGLWNYSSSVFDSALLVAGTSMAGTIDGKYVPSAGAFGFQLPPDALQQDRDLYAAKLHERPHDFSMLLRGNPGEHYGCMTIPFASNELAPLLIEAEKQK